MDLVDLLLETEALQIAPADEPFWYTSGTIGPYYLNTHYLYGGREPAEELLRFIDNGSSQRRTFLPELQERVLQHYQRNRIYRTVVEALVAQIKNCEVESFDYVSGGERRDWFFSIAVAAHVGKTHLAILKDRKVLALTAHGLVTAPTDLDNAAVLHVADLVTEASSYVRAWIPAIAELNGKMITAWNVVDRGQGGKLALRQSGVRSHALIEVGPTFFGALRTNKHINAQQAQRLLAFYQDPRASMKQILLQKPEILARALRSEDAKISERARLLVSQNPYGFDTAFLQRFASAES